MRFISTQKETDLSFRQISPKKMISCAGKSSVRSGCMEGFQENTDITWKPQEKKPFWTLVHFCIWCQDICRATHPAIINEGKMSFDYFHPRCAHAQTHAQNEACCEITTASQILSSTKILSFARNKMTQQRKPRVWTAYADLPQTADERVVLRGESRVVTAL